MFPVVGTFVAIIGMLLFSTLGVDTPIPQVMAYTVVVGIGLGLTMQMLVIAVQNALPPQDMGLSTSSVTFFRSMGGTLGAAVGLALLFSTVRGNIIDRAAAAGFPSSALQSIRTVSLDNTENFGTLPAAAQRVILEGFADSMHTVFLTMACVALVAFVGTWFIKEVPLRTEGGLQAHRSAEREGDLAMAETAVV